MGLLINCMADSEQVLGLTPVPHPTRSLDTPWGEFSIIINIIIIIITIQLLVLVRQVSVVE